MIGKYPHVGIRVYGGGGAAYLPLTTAFIAALETNEGYTMTTAEKDYVNYLEQTIKGLTIYGAYDAFAAGDVGAVYPFVGDTDACSEYDLLTATRVGTAINSPTQGVNGIVLDGGTQTFNVGIIPSTFAVSGNISFTVYNRTSLAGLTSRCLIGAGNANVFADNYHYLAKEGGGTNARYYMNQDPVAPVTTFTDDDLYQCWSYGRVDGTTAVRIKNGTSVTDSSTYGGALPSIAPYVGAINNFGVAIFLAAINVSTAAVHKDLDVTQLEQINNGINAAQVIRGTNV